MPQLSTHFQGRQPSPIRTAQILCMARPDYKRLHVVNLAIGNVSLPIHPAMFRRMQQLTGADSPFAGGVVKYSPTGGLEETRQAFLHLIAASDCATDGLEVVVTDGGSASMELMILGTAGPGGQRPVLMLDPIYSNYVDMARRVGARTVAAPRHLGDDSRYTVPDFAVLERIIHQEKPVAMLIIPADNPTGQFMPMETVARLARLAVEHDLWLVSDEAYRQLNYDGNRPSSIWALDEREAPGIRGRRIGIESASKVWNACGLRIGALVSDNKDFAAKACAEYTANLCASAVGQWIFGALAQVPIPELRGWFEQQRRYYSSLMGELAAAVRTAIPGMIVSSPDSALYCVLDLRKVDPAFDATRFVRFCAERGLVDLDGAPHTLLLAPMTGFQAGAPDPAARTQMRVAFVEGIEVMHKVPRLLTALLAQYRAAGTTPASG